MSGETIQLRSPALAVAKPKEGTIALFVSGAGEDVGCCDLTLAEARHLHDTLGSALQLMRRPGRLPRNWRHAVGVAAGGLVLAVLLAAAFILPALLTGGGRP